MRSETVVVKICGLTVPEEAAACAALGVWGVGVVFAAGSPRRIDAARAAEVLAPVPIGVARVGVFVDATEEEMAAVAARAGLTHLQVHSGDLAAIRRICGLPVIEAIRVEDAGSLDRARSSGADMVLLDAAVPGLHGGTGRAFDWGLLEERPLGRPFALAGGLRPETVGEAVGRLRPAMVDVSSGVESSPGRKDAALVRAFVEAVAAAGVAAWRDAELAARYGPFGGRYVPETVIGALDELEAAYLAYRDDVAFRAELEGLLATFVGRPTPLYRATRLEQAYGVPRLYLKREDLCHTGAHKINNALGQVLLASKMGKRRIIAETGAGQHGVATATAAALLGLECCVYMGRVDMARQRLNVIRMRMLGAEVRPVDSGVGTLKDALNEAIRDWVTNVRDTHYVIGSAAGPAPYPEIVADLQSVIGAEARGQILAEEGRLPEAIVACVGGGSNAIGIFRAFLGDDGVALVGVEAGGEGVETGRHGASLGHGQPGVLHGSYSYLLQTPEGQVSEPHSISAGLDYPGVGPEHSFLRDTGRVRYQSATDAEALAAFQDCSRAEGIIPALESSHALALVARERADLVPGGGPVIVCLSGRGDKDVDAAGAALGLDD